MEGPERGEGHELRRGGGQRGGLGRLQLAQGEEARPGYGLTQ